ncbi:MAG: protease inhibitor I42 family protein [Pseudomonadota bacterium]
MLSTSITRRLSKIISCVLLSLSTLTFAATTNKAQNSQQITDPNKTILVNQMNNQFTITLASTPSTGYSWLLESYNPNFIKLVEHEYVAPIKNMPGTSGVENWTFEVQLKQIAGPQLTQINFVNARMWDVNNTTAKKTNFTIVLY